MEDKEEILKADLTKMINSAVEYRKSQRDSEYINNQAHYEGVYWNLATYNENSPFILKSDINHFKNAIDTRLASLFSNDYSGQLKAKSPDDKEAIDVLQIIYKAEWKRLKMDELVKKVLKDCVVLGDGYLQLSYDADKIEGGTNTRNEGFIKVNYVHAGVVYIDPNATDIESAEYIVYKTRRSEDWVKRNKSSWITKLEAAGVKGPRSSNGQDDGEIYSGGRDYTKEQDKLYILNTVCKKVKFTKKVKTQDELGNTIEEEISGTKTNIYYMISGVIVENNTDYPFDFFDLEKMSCEEIPQCPYGLPLARGLTIPQKVANLIESSINNIAMHYTVPTWLISDDSGIDIDDFSTYQAVLGMVFKVSGDPTKAVSQLSYPVIDEQLVKYANMYVQYIRKYAGINDQYTGDIGSAGNTSGGAAAAISRAVAIDSLIIGQIEKFVESFSKKLIKYIVKYYKDRPIFVRNDKGKSYTFQEYTLKEGIDNMDFDFDIDLVYKTKNDKDRQYNEMFKIYTAQNQYKDPNKLVQALDLVKAAQLDEFPELFKRNSELTEEAMAEKANLMLQLMPALSMVDANGINIVTPEEFQQGIIDVLNDDNDLTVAQGIIKKMEENQQQQVDAMNQPNDEGKEEEINNMIRGV